MLARVVLQRTQHLRQPDQAPQHVAGVASDQGEDTVASGAEWLSEQRLHDALDGEGRARPLPDTDDLDAEAIEGAFFPPGGVDNFPGGLIADSIIDEQTERQAVGRAEVESTPRLDVVKTHAGARRQLHGGDDDEREYIPDTNHVEPSGEAFDQGGREPEHARSW